MVNYTIVCGIPDTNFGFMLHLKSPLEKWSYLENRFGSIPRPESWLVTEEAMQQSDSNAAAETAQDTHSSNDELETSPGGHEDSVDSPNDCTETKSGYLTPETKVIDTRHEEPHLLEVEDRAADSKRPDEGTDTPEAPDEGSQSATNEVEDRQDLPTTSSEALETQGDLPFTTSERTETRTGHRKPENEVVDTRHVVDVLPMFEVGSTGQARYSKHVKELQASDEGGRCASDEVEESRDLPKSSSEVLKPAGNPTRQAGGRSMQDRPQIPSKENQRAWTNSKTIANIPDPLGTPTELSTPHVEHSRLQNRPSARVCSAMSTETDLSYTRRSGKRRKMTHLGLGSERALRRPKRTYQGHFTCETLPDKAQGMGVHRSTPVGWGDSTTAGSTTTTLEIRGLSANTVETQIHSPHWDTTRKEPDKAEDTSGGGDDTASKDFVDSHGVEKMLLAISRSQQGE
ncbi:hypothetical protein F5141DRAFT_1217706 [Pisolithus sp. B1]|nr:hypothetical protein F5141DRAFT_1217706 [Pisolithus sp. B1]